MTRNTTIQAVFLSALMVLSVVAVPFAFAGGVAADHPNPDDGDHLEEGDLVYQGQTVFLNVSNSSENHRLIRNPGDDETVVTQLQKRGDPGEHYVRVRTANRNTGNYEVRNSTTDLVNFDILEQELELTIDDEDSEVSVNTAGPDATPEFVAESNRVEFDLNVTADGLDEEDLEQIFENFNPDPDADEDRVTLENFVADGDGDDLNFTDIDAGEYDFEFEVTDTTASQTITVTVNDVGEGELSVADVDENQGDVAEIVVSADEAATEGTLVIGDEEDVGYQANVTIDDFGDADEITILFNTYTAGKASLGTPVELSSDSDDDGAVITFDSQTTNIDGILDTGSYEMTVSTFTTDNADGEDRFERTVDSPDDVGTLFIEERSTDNLAIWTASPDTVSDLLDEEVDDQPGAAADAIEAGLITQTDTVAHDDYIVHQLEASGLTGALETQSGSAADKLVGLVGEGAVDLRLRETRDSVGPNEPRRTVNLSETDFEVVVDDDNNQLFIVMDSSTIEFQNGDTIADDEDFTVNVRFEVQDPRLLDFDEEEDDDVEDLYQRVEAEFNLEEREGEFDVNSDDMIEVNDDEGQLITGTTNIAPGSEVSIRLRGQSGASFSKSTTDIVVSSDGVFEGEFDFSDRSVDDEFEATLRSAGIDDRPTADGIVVEAVDEVDDEEVDDEEVDDEEVDDEPVETDDDDDTVEETEDDTPGFGAIVALLAVLGAAFLATRRQN